MNQGISVIVCAYNAASRIEETIRHLALQEVPDNVAWEVILVDNHSDDGTVNLANTVWKSINTKDAWKVVREETQGLSYARARGFAEAQFEFVLMCDDDNWLQSDYVALAYSIMTANSKIGALGGQGKITFEVPPPNWIPTISVFATGKQNEFSGKVTTNYLYGAGCVVRQSALQDLKSRGFKQLLTDREGGVLTSGGDYELCYALSIIGYDIWYDERLQFKHFITRNRLTWEYVECYVNESSRCFEILASYKYISMAKRPLPLWLIMLKSGQFSLRMLILCLVNRMRFPSDDKRWKKAYLDFQFYKNNLISFFTGFQSRKRAHQHVLNLLSAH